MDGGAVSAKTTVRLAQISDLPNILRMGREFWKASGASHIGFDERSATELILKLMSGPDGILLVAGDVGMAAAIVFPHYLNSAHITGQELFWWIDPEHRKSGIGKEMFVELEKWARSRAHSFSMIALANGDEIGKFYLSLGYKKLETHYTRTF